MATYLIDFENVGSDGLCGTEQLTENDNVIIFYSTNSGKISMKMHQCICTSRANFKYFEISAGGKNALDFQLSTFLGFLLAKSENEEFFIISKDRGFQHVITFWENRMNECGINSSLIRKTSISAEIENTEISEIVISAEETAENADNDIEITGDVIKSVIQNMDDPTSRLILHKHLVLKLGNEKGTSVYHDIGVDTVLNKQDFHRKMVAKFGQANGTVIYNKLKRLIKK